MMLLLNISVIVLFLATCSATISSPPISGDVQSNQDAESKLLSDFVHSDMKVLEELIGNKEGRSHNEPTVSHQGPTVLGVPSVKKTSAVLPTLPKIQPIKPIGLPILHPPKLAKKMVLPLKVAGLKLGAKTKLAVPKLKKLPLMAKPKVTKLKPIIHVVYKPVPVYHKVPVPKKVIIPKFVPVMKPIPVPKIIPVPYKVPVVKVIPKLVKIPKAVPVPKFVPVKKYIPIGIKVPTPVFHKVPVLKPVPYLKKIPIPIPKPVPKFFPVPVKKIIKVPKPYYVPVKIPHVTKSYIKAPVIVPVPSHKKPMNLGLPGAKFPSHKPQFLPHLMNLPNHLGSLNPNHFGSGKTAFGSMPLLQHMGHRLTGSGKAAFEADLPEDSDHLDERSFDEESEE